MTQNDCGLCRHLPEDARDNWKPGSPTTQVNVVNVIQLGICAKIQLLSCPSEI